MISHSDNSVGLLVDTQSVTSLGQVGVPMRSSLNGGRALQSRDLFSFMARSLAHRIAPFFLLLVHTTYINTPQFITTGYYPHRKATADEYAALAAKPDARTCTALFSSVFRYGGSLPFSAVCLGSSLNSEWLSTHLPSRRRERYAYAAALCPTAVFR